MRKLLTIIIFIFSSQLFANNSINIEKYYLDKCDFKNEYEFKEHFKNIFSDYSKTIISIYNNKYNTSFTHEKINVDFDMAIGNNPEYPAYYDFDSHSIIIELLPASDKEKFIASLCHPESEIYWLIFQGKRISQIAHEIAHWYHSKYISSYKIKGNIFSLDSNLRFSKNRIIIEGIAEYLSNEITKEISIKNSDPDKILKELFEMKNMLDDESDNLDIGLYKSKYYLTGHHLVKPILDSDFKKGIKYLTENTPSEFSENSLKEYQNLFNYENN